MYPRCILSAVSCLEMHNGLQSRPLQLRVSFFLVSLLKGKDTSGEQLALAEEYVHRAEDSDDGQQEVYGQVLAKQDG